MKNCAFFKTTFFFKYFVCFVILTQILRDGFISQFTAYLA